MSEPHDGDHAVSAGWQDPAPPVGWLRAALSAFVVVGAASTVALVRLRLLADDAAGGEADRLGGAQTTAQVLWGVQALVMVAILVLVVVWTRRLAANHVALTRPGTRFGTPGWALGAWLVWFLLPFFVLRELWKGSDASVPEGSPAWRGVPTTPLLPTWFLTFVVGTFTTNLTNDALAASSRTDPEHLAALALWRAAATAVLVISALLLHRLAGRLTRRQEAAVAAS